MNIFSQMGEWWESRRVLRQKDEQDLNARIDMVCMNTGLRIKQLADAQEELKKAQQLPQLVAKEITILKTRLDRLELLTGLKREPEAVHVKDAARIK